MQLTRRPRAHTFATSYARSHVCSGPSSSLSIANATVPGRCCAYAACTSASNSAACCAGTGVCSGCAASDGLAYARARARTAAAEVQGLHAFNAARGMQTHTGKSDAALTRTRLQPGAREGRAGQVGRRGLQELCREAAGGAAGASASAAWAMHACTRTYSTRAAARSVWLYPHALLTYPSCRF